MAIKSTIFKVALSVADVTRNYYEDHAFTVARHPSETDLRLLVRLMAFALNAHEHLQLTKGLASADEPDLWQLSLTGEIEHWIELGQPVEKRLRQSCGKASRVSVYNYQKSASHMWFEAIKADVERFAHLGIYRLTMDSEADVEKMMDRSMRLNCLIDDDRISLSDDSRSVAALLTTLKTPEKSQ